MLMCKGVDARQFWVRKAESDDPIQYHVLWSQTQSKGDTGKAHSAPNGLVCDAGDDAECKSRAIQVIFWPGMSTHNYGRHGRNQQSVCRTKHTQRSHWWQSNSAHLSHTYIYIYNFYNSIYFPWTTNAVMWSAHSTWTGLTSTKSIWKMPQYENIFATVHSGKQVMHNTQGQCQCCGQQSNSVSRLERITKVALLKMRQELERNDLYRIDARIWRLPV